ncbi:MAG: hypothetical protein LIO93_00885, partial [Bacteroidales bacterium]|nr:hypothetical protein [Bacteroidales bacterium]
VLLSLFVLLILLPGNIYSQNSISFGTGTNPSNIIKQGDPVSFTRNIINSLGAPDHLDAYFTLSMPSEWILADIEGYDIEEIKKGNISARTYKISGLNLPGNGQSVSPVVQIQPLCDIKNGDELIYNLYDSHNSLLIGPIIHTISANIITPSFIANGPYDLQTVKNRLEEREYSITISSANAYVKKLKIEIERLSVTEIYINDISIKGKDGNFIALNDMPISRLDSIGNKYIVYIEEDAIQALTGNVRLEYNQPLTLKEKLLFTKCESNVGSTSLTYTLFYGNEENWCSAGLSNENTISILANVFQPWIEWVTTAGSSNYNYTTNIIPKKSNAKSIEEGRGQRIYRIANYSNEDIPLRDIRTKFSTGVAYLNEYSGQFVVETAYFCDKQGNRLLPENRDIKVDRNGIPGDKTAYGLTYNSRYVPYQDIIRFDLLTQEQVTNEETNTSIPLVSLDNDGLFNDLPSGEWFYFAIEYNIYYQNFVFDPLGNIYRNNFLSFWRSYMNLYYLDNCGAYQPFGFSSTTSGDNALTAENYPALLLRPDKQIRAVGTNNGEAVVNVGPPSISMVNQELTDIRDIRPNDEAAVKIQVPPISGGLSRAQFLTSYANINDTYVHTVKATLPEGFSYDPSFGVKIRSNQNETSSLVQVGGVKVTTNDDGKQIVEFRNTVFFSNRNTWIYIGIKDDNTDNKNNPRTDKDMKFSFFFNFKDELPVEYAYFTIPLDYNKVFSCDRIELVSFHSERTTFGYTDKTMQTRATKNDGVNVKTAGPYHNVSHIGEIKVHQDVMLGEEERFLVKLSYQSNQQNSYFSFPDKDKAVVLLYKAAGQNTFADSIFIPENDLRLIYRKTKHEIIADLTPYINAPNGISLNTEDQLMVVFLSQTTESIPRVPTPINELQMETYTEIPNPDSENDPFINSCGPLAESFKLFDYKLGSIVSANSGFFELNGEGTGGIVRWQLQNGSPGNSEEFTNEFVPNSTFTTLSVELNGIFIIDELSIYASGSNIDNVNVGISSGNPKILDPDIYDIAYLNGKTIVTIHNDPGTPTIESEVWDGYGAGLYILAKYHFIGALPEDLLLSDGKANAQKASIKINALDYPSSENPQVANYELNSADFIVAFTYNEYLLTPISGSSTPGVGDAEWEFNLTNDSKLLDGKGKYLPNSWLSLKCDPGLLQEIVLYENTPDGQIEIGSFKEAEENTGKFWIKLGTLEVSKSNKNYVIKARQNACDEGTYPLELVFGMNNSKDGYYDENGILLGTPLYPKDPWTGFESLFNTSYLINSQNKSKLTLSLRVNETQLSVEAKDPEYTEGKIYPLCEPFTIHASYSNGQDFKIIDLGLKIYLLPGLKFDDNSVKVKIGDEDSWNTLSGMTVNTENPDYVLITFPDDFILEEYGKPQSKITVQFQITPSCGFNGKNITIDMLAKKYCGTDIHKRIYTNRLPVTYITDNDPVINFQSVIINETDGENNYDNPIKIAYDPANDGSIKMETKYYWTANSSPFYIYVDYPAGIDAKGKLYITETGTELEFSKVNAPDGVSGATQHVGVEVPDIGSGTFPLTLKVDMEFEPTEDYNLDCSLYSI